MINAILLLIIKFFNDDFQFYYKASGPELIISGSFYLLSGIYTDELLVKLPPAAGASGGIIR